MGTADRQHEPHRVETDEHRGRERVAALELRALPHQRHAAESGQRRDRLERPQHRRHAQRRDRVGTEREQRTVGIRVVVAAGVRIGLVEGRRADAVRVRVEVMDGAQPPVLDVVEDVLGQQRGRKQEQQVEHHHRPHRDPRRH